MYFVAIVYVILWIEAYIVYSFLLYFFYNMIMPNVF